MGVHGNVQTGADAEAVDGRLGLQQGPETVLVQIPATEDGGFLEAALIQYLPHFTGMLR
jgi:hypothetical protein